jgi:hypothetical protein
VLVTADPKAELDSELARVARLRIAALRRGDVNAVEALRGRIDRLLDRRRQLR